MTDPECVHLLQWALPRLRMRWPGLRKVRKQVRKRITARLAELALPDAAAYRSFLQTDSGEWEVLRAACRITISRFYRDRRVFDLLRRRLLPALADAAQRTGRERVRLWSAGCASGEEPYTLAAAWHFDVTPRWPRLSLQVIATDIDEQVLERARAGCYSASSLKDLPPDWRRLCFVPTDGGYRFRDELRRDVEFRRDDVRAPRVAGPFDLVLCRNLVFTYFDEDLQREVLDRLAARLRPGGALVLGSRESLPFGATGLVEREGVRTGIYSSVADRTTGA